MTDVTPNRNYPIHQTNDTGYDVVRIIQDAINAIDQDVQDVVNLVNDEDGSIDTRLDTVEANINVVQGDINSVESRVDDVEEDSLNLRIELDREEFTKPIATDITYYGSGLLNTVSQGDKILTCSYDVNGRLSQFSELITVNNSNESRTYVPHYDGNGRLIRITYT